MKTITVCAPSPYNTLCITCANDESSVLERLSSRLPRPILEATYLHHDYSDRYSLRVRLRGGKGGFGSQLRAAGGRKRRGNKDVNAMADVSGRKLRTIQRAETLISKLRQGDEAVERREKRDELVRLLESGGEKSQRVLFQDEDYLETSERLLEDLKRAMNQVHDGHCSSSSDQDEEDGEQGTVGGPSGHLHQKQDVPLQNGPRKLPGWDDDDDLHDSSDDDDETVPAQPISIKGKEKAQVPPIATIKDVHVRKRVKAS